VCKPSRLTFYVPSSPTSTAGSNRRASSHEWHGSHLAYSACARCLSYVHGRARLRGRAGPHT
jgi:hypothetical protein